MNAHTDTTTDTMTTTAQTAQLVELFTPCDACHVARAIVTVVRGDATLAFCGHHHGRYFLAMVEQGWEVK